MENGLLTKGSPQYGFYTESTIDKLGPGVAGSVFVPQSQA